MAVGMVQQEEGGDEWGVGEEEGGREGGKQGKEEGGKEGQVEGGKKGRGSGGGGEESRVEEEG